MSIYSLDNRETSHIRLHCRPSKSHIRYIGFDSSKNGLGIWIRIQSRHHSDRQGEFTWIWGHPLLEMAGGKLSHSCWIGKDSGTMQEITFCNERVLNNTHSPCLWVMYRHPFLARRQTLKSFWSMATPESLCEDIHESINRMILRMTLPH